MSRSVSYLNGDDVTVVYYSGHDFEDSLDFEDFLFDIKQELQALFPSLSECSRYENENYIFLENCFCEIATAEYNGLISVSMRAIEDEYYGYSGLAIAWTEKAAVKFSKLGNLVKRGTFSNGEAIFETKNDNKTYSSKEGLLEFL